MSPMTVHRNFPFMLINQNKSKTPQSVGHPPVFYFTVLCTALYECNICLEITTRGYIKNKPMLCRVGGLNLFIFPQK